MQKCGASASVAAYSRPFSEAWPTIVIGVRRFASLVFLAPESIKS